MAKRDYYEVLGLEREASESDIKSAYRKQALKYHPDRNQGDSGAEAKFKEASEAYEVLSDPEKKSAYDRYGHAGIEGNFGTGGFQWSDFTHASDFEDLFGELFGGIFGSTRRQRGPSGPPKGRDLRVVVQLTLEEIATGVEKKIHLNRQGRCGECGGSGAAPGSYPRDCETCGGVGQVQQVTRSFFGQSVTVTACPTCHGEGKEVADPCRECRGEGTVRDRATLTVKIPAGVSTGNYIPLRGEGDAGRRGGPAGDCQVFIEEQPHPDFQREGNDVLYRLPITITQAALGDNAQVLTLVGKVKMRIPEGTQSGHVLRLRGKGIPDVDGRGVGDQLVEITVWTPTHLSARERNLLEELDRLHRDRAAREGKGFFDRMRDAFCG